MTTHLEIGTSFLETLWFSYASRIVEKAILIYELDEEAATALREKYLKRGDYVIKTHWVQAVTPIIFKKAVLTPNT